MNAMFAKRFGTMGTACLCLLIGFATSANNAQEPRRVINVKTVGQLYAAVNDSANRNVTVRLAPGTYFLSTYTKNNVLRRNRGALRMPPGMSLVGSEKRVDTNGDGVPDPVSDETPDNFTVPGTETIIDGTALDLPYEDRADCTGQIFPAPNPVIHVGVHNLISHLTIIPGLHVAIGEPTNNPVDPNGNLSMRVSYTVLDGLMTFANCECAARRARSVLTFSHNVVRGGSVLILNFLTGDASNDASDGPAIWATLTSNLFYNSGRALQVEGGAKGTDGGTLTLDMSGNVFRNNATNFRGIGALLTSLTTTVGNRLTVRSEFDTFGEAFAGEEFSNVFLISGGGEADEPQDTKLDAEFRHSHFIRDSDDTPAEMSIIGGTGSHNRARVLIRGATVTTSEGFRRRGGFLIQDKLEPGVGTSTARLGGSRSEFIEKNQGLPAPPEHFFLEH